VNATLDHWLSALASLSANRTMRPREIGDKVELVRHLTVWLKSAAKPESLA
jgi:hypothetical protein